VVLAPYYRSYDLPWEGDPESSRRFRRYVTGGLIGFVLFAIIAHFIPKPEVDPNVVPEVPERLARLMTQEKPKPPPPPPPPKPVDEPKPEEPKPVPPPPEQRVQQARQQAEKQLSRVKDELADLRREMAQAMPAPSANLTTAVSAESRADRSLITSKAGTGSAGVVSADSTRGFGGGAGALSGHSTGTVSSTVASIGADRQATRGTGTGKGRRGEEDIAQEFDKNKGAIYALYNRALRERPELQGKLVLEFTIAPTGEVIACRVVSSELNDPELERKIVARVKLIRFPAGEFSAITTTKPIEFFPG
jgi:periplasmic protein TonB